MHIRQSQHHACQRTGSKVIIQAPVIGFGDASYTFALEDLRPIDAGSSVQYRRCCLLRVRFLPLSQMGTSWRWLLAARTSWRHSCPYLYTWPARRRAGVFHCTEGQTTDLLGHSTAAQYAFEPIDVEFVRPIDFGEIS